MLDTQIDPAELVFAVQGVRPLIDKDFKFFSKSHADEASGLPRMIEAMIRRLCDDELIDTPLFDTDYDKTLKELYEDWSPAQVEAFVNSVAKHVGHLDMALMTKAKSVIDYLRSIFPRSSFPSFPAAVNLTPNDVAVYQFESVLEVLDYPLRVFALIQQGAITKRQIAAVRLVYPTLSAAIDEALISIVADRKVEKKSYELPPAAEIGVTKWYGQPAVNPKLSAQLQAVAAKPKQPSPPVPAATSPKTSVLARESLSSAERALYPSAK